MGIMQELMVEAELYDVHKMFEDFMKEAEVDHDAETQVNPALSDNELNTAVDDAAPTVDSPTAGPGGDLGFTNHDDIGDTTRRDINFEDLIPKGRPISGITDTTTVDVEPETEPAAASTSTPAPAASTSTPAPAEVIDAVRTASTSKELPPASEVASAVKPPSKPIEKGFLFAAYNAVKSSMNDETKNAISQFLEGVAKTHAGVYNAVKAVSDKLTSYIPFLPTKWKQTLGMAIMFLLIVNGTGLVGGVVPAVLVAKAFAVGRIASFAFKTAEDAKKAKAAAEKAAATAPDSTAVKIDEVPPLAPEEKKDTELAIDKAISKYEAENATKTPPETESSPEIDHFAALKTAEDFTNLKNKITSMREYLNSKPAATAATTVTESNELLFESVLNEGLRQALKDASAMVGKEIANKFVNAVSGVAQSSKDNYNKFMGALNKKADEYVPGWRKMDNAVKNKIITTVALTALGLGAAQLSSIPLEELKGKIMGTTPEQIEQNIQKVSSGDTSVPTEPSPVPTDSQQGTSPQAEPTQVQPVKTADSYDNLVPENVNLQNLQGFTNTPEYNQLVQDSTQIRLSRGFPQAAVPQYQQMFGSQFKNAVMQVAQGGDPKSVFTNIYGPGKNLSIGLNEQMAEGILKALVKVSEASKK